jgi:hypothetical protein
MMPTETGFELIRDADGSPYAINLGYSRYADHRVGFEKLAQALGVGQGNEDGIERLRTCQPKKDSTRNMWVMNIKAWERPFDNGWKTGVDQFPAETRLMVAPSDSWDFDLYREDDLSQSFVLRRDGDNKWPEMQTAWSSHGFLIRAFSAEARAFTKALAKAVKENDVALGTGEDLCMGDGRMVVAIASRVPEHVLNQIAERHSEPDHANSGPAPGP